jgi:hypothetical protein
MADKCLREKCESLLGAHSLSCRSSGWMLHIGRSSFYGGLRPIRPTTAFGGLEYTVGLQRAQSCLQSGSSI